MKFSSMRSAVVIASVIVGSVIPSQAFAQIDVLTARDPSNPSYTNTDYDGPITSTYTFNTSMILNSIDFVTYGEGDDYGLLEYSISSVNNGTFQTVAFDNNNLGQESDYRRRFTFANAVTLSANDVVRVRTTDTIQGDFGTYTPLQRFGAIDSNVNISVVRNDRGVDANFSNSNLRVSPSNPGSNVAPEPGTFALALTGGGALIGICIRRRRNAA
jgi:hypothetical protein